jgi:hypothetical protein
VPKLETIFEKVYCFFFSSPTNLRFFGRQGWTKLRIATLQQSVILDILQSSFTESTLMPSRSKKTIQHLDFVMMKFSHTSPIIVGSEQASEKSRSMCCSSLFDWIYIGRDK